MALQIEETEKQAFIDRKPQRFHPREIVALRIGFRAFEPQDVIAANVRSQGMGVSTAHAGGVKAAVGDGLARFARQRTNQLRPKKIRCDRNAVACQRVGNLGWRPRGAHCAGAINSGTSRPLPSWTSR